MNTIQIKKVLTKHVKYFQGVYPIDLLPSTLKKPPIFGINLDKHYMPGSYWVAVCFSDSGYAEYFDSYGLPPYKLEIMAYLQRHSISWTFNRHRLQGLTSNSADITAAFIPSTEPGTTHDVISRHVRT
jgi:hypothetical protein